jgi:hypothetical protein
MLKSGFMAASGNVCSALARFPARGALLFGCLLPAACAGSYAASPIAVPQVDAGATCELRLHIEHGTDELRAVEVADNQSTYGVCVKRQGQPLVVPERIQLVGEDLASFGYVCEDEPKAIAGSKLQICVWNHVYRNTYPFTFRLTAASGLHIADLITNARVYRNGKLIGRYNNASGLADPQTLIFSAKSLQVPDSPFVERPPHRADMDLRLLPAGVELNPAALEEVVFDARDRARRRVQGAFGAGLHALEQEDPALLCALARLQFIRGKLTGWFELSGNARPAAPAGAGAADCPLAVLPPAPAGAPVLPKGQQELVTVRSEELKQLDATVAQQVSAVRAWVDDAIGFVRTKAAPVLKSPVALDAFDRGVQEVEQALDEVEQMAVALRHATLRLVEDRRAQAKAYDAVVSSLETSGTVFEAYTANPELVERESRLAMQHGDSFQWFALAPWNGIAFRLAGDVGTDVGLENLIPILDVVGMRFQWNRSRFTDARLALGVMYFRDNQLEPTPDEPERTVEVFNFAFQGNVSAANFKLGVAWVPGSEQPGDNSYFREHFRVLLGVDLIKLVSGSTPELL